MCQLVLIPVLLEDTLMMTDRHNKFSNAQRASTSSDIAIRVKNGIAIITGTAATIAEKMRAEEAVYAMADVVHVHNLMKTTSD